MKINAYEEIDSFKRAARAGIVGGPFDGMGDFALPPDVMYETIGIESIL
jgi:hypothetical protein